MSPLLSTVFPLLWLSLVVAQPTPERQAKISQAIVDAQNQTKFDYASFVNVFIGTDNYGDVCPGASIPFGMAKITTDMTGYAPSGYVTDATQYIRGLSPLHDSGTGASGSYGNFAVMPLLCPDGFETCATRYAARERLRQPYSDDGYPGYFSLTLNNSLKMEATATRRAGLERFTFPSGSKPYFSIDLARDLADTFAGGELAISPEEGRVTIGGHWGPSFGPSSFHYQAFACYDLLNGGNQTLDEYGIWRGNDIGLDAKGLGLRYLNLTDSLIGDDYESGVLFSYAGNYTEIILRVGVSFVSVDQACANAEEETGSASFEEIKAHARALWNEKLSRIEIDVANTPANVSEMLFFFILLCINNATGEGQGPFEDTDAFYFDSLYCSLHSPVEFAQIVDAYIDGWRKLGWMPECRGNNLPAWTQGGSSADNIVSHFAVHYHNEARDLGVDLEELYSALLADGELNPAEWDIMYGYVPAGVLDVSSIGRQTREASRTLEYAFEDFGIRQVAQLLGDNEGAIYFGNRSYSYRNVWDASVESDGFTGFPQKRLMNGTFVYSNPVTCSPVDTNGVDCSLQSDNVNGFYESSAWEYAWFAPHDTAQLITLMGGNDTFVDRLDHFFSTGYYQPGNEPSFQTPVGYHYADHPAQSVDRIRDIVMNQFSITSAGLPGNDDQAAMASLLTFHLLGLYPVPSTTQYLVLSPFIPKYTIHNSYMNTSTTVTTINYNASSVQATIPPGTAAYVGNVTVNGVASSRCHLDFYDVFRVGGNVTIELTADKDAVDTCEGSLPESLSTGGFSQAR
ncbi:glycoside hydrolase family 92 protein [Fistulina hepatica ATCC 64428]|nr:glycoside hydrolase family 92 protein [Fistulina hepatica ATCC 64428]